VYVIIGFFGDVYAETLAVFDRRDDPLSHSQLQRWQTRSTRLDVPSTNV